MKTKKKTGRSRKGLALGAATILTFGMVGVVGAGPAAAEPVQLDVTYECPFPLIGLQQITARITADVPPEATVGVPVPAFDVDIVSTMNPTVTQGLTLVGAKTLEIENAVSEAIVDVPGLRVPIKMPVDLETVDVPASGSFDIPGRGQSPSLTFAESNVGTGTIHVGDTAGPDADGDLMLTGVTPRDANGALTGLGVFDSVCTLVGTEDVLASFEIVPADTSDTEAPSAPGTPTVSGTTTDSVSLTWPESTDNVGVTGYDVYDADGTKVADSTSNSATVSGLTPDTEYSFTVKARDAAGNESAASAAVTARTQPEDTSDTEEPSAPGDLSGTAEATSATLSWTASTDNVGVTGYDVYQNGAKVSTVTETTATVTGLTPETAYQFKVQASDAAGNQSEFSDEITVTTKAGGGGGTKVPYSYALAGETFVKAPNGKAPLSGDIDALLDVNSGEFTADLALDDTSGNFKIFGFLPVKAQIGFTPEGQTTGTLQDGVLTSNSKMTVRLPSMTLAGIPLGGGENCKSKTPADITLKSTQDFFNPLAGGPVAGTYTLPALTGCGTLTPLLSALTSGPGNTIDLTLTPES